MLLVTLFSALFYIGWLITAACFIIGGLILLVLLKAPDNDHEPVHKEWEKESEQIKHEPQKPL